MTVSKLLVFWLLLFSKVIPALQSPVSFIRSSLMSSKRLSRDHHDMEGLTTSLAPRENPPRDIAAEVFNNWLASKYALTSSATIADLMKSCTDYVEATGVDKDSLGGLLDFDKTRGFKKRMDAAKVKGGARIIVTGNAFRAGHFGVAERSSHGGPASRLSRGRVRDSHRFGASKALEPHQCSARKSS